MKAIIVGASSGIGLEVAKLLLAEGWQLGVAARREGPLQDLKAAAPERVEIMTIDVTESDAGEKLLESSPQATRPIAVARERPKPNFEIFIFSPFKRMTGKM